MKRNSTSLFLECPNATLPVPWSGLDNVLANIQSTYQSPTRNVAIASWQAFVASGDELEVIPDPVPVPPPVIAREIDARRLRLALLELGRLAAVEAAVASLGQAAIIDWEYATTIREDYPLAQALSSQLGLDVDAVFDLAETLT